MTALLVIPIITISHCHYPPTVIKSAQISSANKWETQTKPTNQAYYINRQTHQTRQLTPLITTSLAQIESRCDVEWWIVNGKGEPSCILYCWQISLEATFFFWLSCLTHDDDD